MILDALSLDPEPELDRVLVEPWSLSPRMLLSSSNSGILELEFLSTGMEGLTIPGGGIVHGSSTKEFVTCGTLCSDQTLDRARFETKQSIKLSSSKH